MPIDSARAELQSNAQLGHQSERNAQRGFEWLSGTLIDRKIVSVMFMRDIERPHGFQYVGL